jgi:hypothetical protein
LTDSHQILQGTVVWIKWSACRCPRRQIVVSGPITSWTYNNDRQTIQEEDLSSYNSAALADQVRPSAPDLAPGSRAKRCRQSKYSARLAFGTDPNTMINIGGQLGGTSSGFNLGEDSPWLSTGSDSVSASDVLLDSPPVRGRFVRRRGTGRTIAARFRLPAS